MQQRYTREEIFNRQLKTSEWDDKKLSQQVCLLVGTGGLGTCICQGLLRLGVQEIHLVDYDVVDVHNLNRQLLFGLNDVDVSQVEAAQNNAEQLHNVGSTNIETHHYDAVKNFDKIIALASQSDVIFNCCDYGDSYDLALMSLCMILNIPYISGGAYDQSLQVDYYHESQTPCLHCICKGGSGVDKSDPYQPKIKPSNILSLKDLSFLPRNNNPVGQSNYVLCSLTANIQLDRYLYHVMNKPEDRKSIQGLFYIMPFNHVEYELEGDPTCLFCNDMKNTQMISCVNLESTYIPVLVNQVWDRLFNFKLEDLFGNLIEKVSFKSGGPGINKSVAVITFIDQVEWEVLINQISENKRSISYDIISSSQVERVSSRTNVITLEEVTISSGTFVKWETRFSSDVTRSVLSDTKYKQLDCLSHLEKLKF